MRKHPLDRHSPEECVQKTPPMMCLHMVAGVFQQVAVGDPAGTDRLAGPAPEAKIEMSHRRFPEREPSLLERAHQVDAPPRGIVLIPCLQIRGA
jgi:hypothetical protein